MNRRRNIKPYKINRGSFEEQKLKEDNQTQTQRALLFILPVVMLAVLAVGIFFGYIGYSRAAEEERRVEGSASLPTEEESESMLLRAVNSVYPMGKDEVPPLTTAYGVKVAPEMADSLNNMLSDAENAGYKIEVKSGYISYEEQSELYDSAVKKYRKEKKSTVVAAEAHVRKTTPRAGESEQQTGMVVYLTAKTDGNFSDSDAYAWLVKNCVSYGFILRYPDTENVGGMGYSSHLFRYVGTEHAYYITAYDMDFDEYVAYLASR